MPEAESQEGTDMQYITDTSLEFKTDQLTGRLISIHHRDTGWVEYLNKFMHIWVANTPILTVHQDWQQQSIDHITEHYSTESEVIGLVQHLARVRLDQPFIMPMFVNADSRGNLTITAGNCRRDACVANSVLAKEISAIVYSAGDTTPTGFSNIRKLETTEEFESLYQLADIDYRISVAIDKNDNYVIISSVIRHTIFDRTTIEKAHVETANACFGFWHRFVNKKTNKIDIEIRCTESASVLIKESPLFNVSFVYEPENEWAWSYGKILGSYRQTDDPVEKGKLSLWLFDLVEPVNLELLLPWADNKFSSFYSKNQKSVLFETSHITSMQVIGDWVN